MGGYNDVLSLAFSNRLLQEIETAFMLFVESGKIQPFSTCHDAVEVRNGAFSHVSILNRYL